MNDSKCHGIMGKIFGHDFEPRYNKTDTTDVSVAKEASEIVKQYLATESFPDESMVEEIMDGFRGLNSETKTYVHDVCSRCGLIIRK